MQPTNWHILLIDDDDDDYLLAQALLRSTQGYRIRLDWAPGYASGLEKLAGGTYDAILVDYDLGARTGIDFIRQAAQLYPALPLILYTGRGSQEVDLEAMQSGASLYLTKAEANPMLLTRSIRYAIERKRAEIELRQSRESYRQLFSSMLDGFSRHEIILDEQGCPVDYRFLEVNPAFEKLTGLNSSDIVGRTVKEVLPEIEDIWIQRYGEVALTGVPARFENHTAALGKTFSVVAFSPGPLEFAVVFTDITAQKEQERMQAAYQEELEQQVQARTSELQRANEILERIFSNIHIAVALLDPQFNFIRVNETYAGADERTPAFFVGKNHFELFPNPENEAIFRQVRDSGRPYAVFAKPFEYAHNPERGVTVWDWSLQPIKEGGEVCGLLLTLVDVTGRFSQDQS
jgi:PAS domain S-box-containing protein